MIKFDDSKGLRSLFLLMIIGTVVSLILIFGYNYNQKTEYPQPSFEASIQASISNLSKYQSVIMIELGNDKKYMIIDSRNYAYDPYLIQDFLQIGDYIKKESGSDTLEIIRGKQTFTFVIGKDLNIDL